MSQRTAPDPATGTGRDRTTRQAALWATVVALPLTLLLALVLVNRLAPDDDPAAAPTTAAPTTGVPTLQQVPAAPVPMTATALTERQTVVCRALLSQLPDTVRNLPQRPVSAGSEQNAAYGDPPLTVTCGAPPPSVPPEDDVWTVNRVCWHVANGPEGAVASTVDREVPVRVAIPGQYEQPLQWLPEISETLVASVPAMSDVPTGCRP